MELVIPIAARKAPKRSFFDFVVADRPIYTPGSGPPVPKPTIMPIHDKDGIIMRKIPPNEKMRIAKYVVTFEDKPYLRISVDERKVLDYVSARTYENFHHEEYHEMLRKEIQDPRSKAKDERKRQEENGEKPARAKPRKKRKKLFSAKATAPTAKLSPLAAPDIAVRRGTSELAEKPKAFISPQRPTQTSPSSKQRGLAQAIGDSEDEDNESDQNGLDREFQNEYSGSTESDDPLATNHPQSFRHKPKAGPSRLSQQHNALSFLPSISTSPEPEPRKFQNFDPEPVLPPGKTRATSSGFSTSTTPDPTPKPLQKSISISNPPAGVKRETSSRPSTSSSPRSDTKSRTASKRQRTSLSAVASTSSLEAGRIYEALSQNDTPKNNSSKKSNTESIHSRYASSQTRAKSIFTTKSPSKSSPPATINLITSSSGSSSEDEIETDPEYDVEAILSSRWTKDKNKNPIQEFLIKWVGWPDPTWENEDNVGSELRASFNTTQDHPSSSKASHRKSIVDITLIDSDSNDEGRKKKKLDQGKRKKKAIPGDTGDEESLFLPGPPPGRSKRSPYFSELDAEDSRPSSRESGRSRNRKRVSFSAETDLEFD